MKKCNTAFVSLLLYCFGAHFISKMKYVPEGIANYGLSLLLCMVFMSCLNYSNVRNISKCAYSWVPYIVFTIIGCTIFGYFRLTALWIVSLLIVGLSQGYSIADNLPIKIIINLGLFQVFGELLQLFYPNLYNSIIHFYFGPDFKMFGTGLQGFTEQTAILASTLLLLMGALIYYKLDQKRRKYLVVIAIIVMIFMSGKRSFSAMAIIIPLAVNVLSQKNSSKMLYILSITLLLGTILFSYFVENAGQYQNIPGMKKISETFSEVQSEDDIMNGRELLWATAIVGFQENPIIGIGTGRFMDWSGLPTNAHNAYLQVLCEQGLIGFLLFVIPLIICLIKTINISRMLPQGTPADRAIKYSMFIQLFFIIYAFSGNPTRNEYCFLMYFIAIGIMTDCQYKQKTLFKQL